MTDSAFLVLGKAKLDGEVTRLLLRRKKIQQKSAAYKIKVSPAQFVQYLNGKYPIPSRPLIRLLKILKINDPLLILRAESHV